MPLAASTAPPRPSGSDGGAHPGGGPDWSSVLDGHSEIGFGGPTAPAGLGDALAEGPDVCESVDGCSPDALRALCLRFCSSPAPARPLQGWLEALIGALHGLMPAARLRIRLERLRGAGCSRLHVDQVPLRLLCTLHGPGTEWWPAPVEAREHLLRPGKIQPPPTRPLQRMATGLPALLRGERFALCPGAGVVHRSPAPDDRTRVLLAIDVMP